MEKIYNKLVRDRIPEIIESNGEIPTTRILGDEEYIKELEKKLLEEYNEMLKTETIEDRLEELADIIEVVSALCDFEASTLENVMTIMKDKRAKRGGFSKRLFLEKVIEKE